MEQILGFAESLPAGIQWLGVILIGAIPFVESYFGSVVGILAGVPAPVAVIAASIGNIVCMTILVTGADAGRKKAVAAYSARKAAPVEVGAGVGASRQTPAAPASGRDEPGAEAGESRAPRPPASGRRGQVQKAFERFGVPGVSLFGQAFLASQITSVMLVGFGANRNTVIAWQILGIILWGVVFGLLASFGVDFLHR